MTDPMATAAYDRREVISEAKYERERERGRERGREGEGEGEGASQEFWGGWGKK